MREDSWEQETRKSYHQRRGWVVQVWRNLEGLLSATALGSFCCSGWAEEYNYRLFLFGERNAQCWLQQTKSAPLRIQLLVQKTEAPQRANR